MATEMVDSMKFGANYQVFLSFRGPDTRKGFTDCLYHFLTSAGIRVFKDDEDQPLGEKIEKILDAINNSTVCIPIFSRGYASSKWCLKELAKMMNLGKKIIPIFYDVTPDDVKLKTGLYVEALMKHEKSSTKDQDVALELEKWKEALAKVGTFTGRELRDTGYGEFSQSIVNEVLIKLKNKQKLFSSQLVGMEEQVEALTKLLEVKSSDRRFVGIHGMGGIGKTTLAKLVFNHLSSHFECCSFLSDVRELSKRNPEQLYKNLLADIRSKLGVLRDRENMVKTIIDVIHNKKVLIVLDDVDEKEQIKEFAGIFAGTGSGSKIIITTRDKGILVEAQEKVREFEMKEMNLHQALQLFSKRAFNEDCPPSDYLDLSKEMVSIVGRLPLSLEITGSHLRGKCKEEWKENMRAFARVPHKDVQKQRRISFEYLDYREKQVFLDIACFFANKEKTNVSYMWDACDFHPVSALNNLISKSMVTIVDDNKLWMHDQLRALGREIVCMENFRELGRRSRLWNHKEGMDMLKRGEGTRKVEALCISYDYWSPSFSFTPVGFKKMRNLRILECHGMGLAGDFQDVLTKLIWLSWHFCPTDFKDTVMNCYEPGTQMHKQHNRKAIGRD